MTTKGIWRTFATIAIATIAFSLTVGAEGDGTWSYTSMVAFDGSDGYDPNVLIFGPDGNLYGTAQDGNLNYGLVYQLFR